MLWNSFRKNSIFTILSIDQHDDEFNNTWGLVSFDSHIAETTNSFAMLSQIVSYYSVSTFGSKTKKRLVIQGFARLPLLGIITVLPVLFSPFLGYKLLSLTIAMASSCQLLVGAKLYLETRKLIFFLFRVLEYCLWVPFCR